MTDYQPRTSQPLQFVGTTGEFFKIWIVNVMLSILTLGIYSAWAKVRTKRYFYGNTLLMGTPFDYLGDPLKILKGRLIAFAILVLYSLSNVISPEFQAGVMLIFIPLLPWIIIKALRFNAYNSAYRNIRFGFHAKYLSALWTFIGLPFLVALSLGMAYPYFVRARKKFVIEHSAYGKSQFEFQAATGDFYSIYLKAYGVFFLLIVAFAVAGSVIVAQPIKTYEELSAIAILAMLLIVPLFLLISAYVYTSIANLVINKTALENHRFESRLQFGRICWLYFSNTVLIVLSLGLLIPWAMIRTTHYRLSNITVLVHGQVDEFIAAEADRVEAIGEEVGDLFDLDIGL